MPRLSEPKLLANDFDFAKAVPDWQVNLDTQELERVFVFRDFKAAFEFMTLSANKAEELDHHPDWSNSWNRVSVRLSTHSHTDWFKVWLTPMHYGGASSRHAWSRRHR